MTTVMPTRHSAPFFASTLGWRIAADALVGHKPTSRKVLGLAFQGDGYTKAGVWVQYNALLYPVLFRVLVVADDCEDLRAGDVVRVREPMVWTEVDLPDGQHFSVMDERRAIAIVADFDEKADQ